MWWWRQNDKKTRFFFKWNVSGTLYVVVSSVKPKKRKKGKKEKCTEDMNRTFRNASPKKQQTQGTGSVSP